MKTTFNNYKELGNLTNAIYKLSNPNEKLYVGKFLNINRLDDYVNLSCKSQIKLYNSLKKYGVENHTIEILTYNQKEKHLNKYEQAYIRYYYTFNNGLNCTLGGEGLETPTNKNK